MNMAARDRLKGRKTLQVGNFLDEFEKDDVKKQVDIVALFQHFGVGLTKKGKSYLGKCPWHDDKSPSLSVDREKGLYNCFGCGESGDIFTLTEKMKGLSFKESLAYLKDFSNKEISSPLTASRPQDERVNDGDTKDSERKASENAGRDAAPGKAEAKQEEPSKEVPASDMANEQSVTLTSIAEYYHKRLFENEPAMTYLKSRSLDNAGLLGRFQVGFSDNTLLEKISDSQKTSLQKQGIITDKDREHFQNCITFPIFDDLDNVVGFYGRSINEKAQVKHLYIKGEHKSVFNRKTSKVYDEIILTESIIDALSLIQLGFENVQSIYGTNGFTDEHLHILKDDRVKTVICAFDADQAGSDASEKIKGKLVSEGFAIKVISPPTQKDWNEYLISDGDVSVIQELIPQAETFKQEEQSSEHFSVSKDQLGHVFTINDIQYRVTGVKDMFISNLRVNVKVELKGTSLKYYDNLDLYSARSRTGYAGNMGRSFDIEPSRVERDLISILEYLENERDRLMLSGASKEHYTELTPEERKRGLVFLTDPDMFTEITIDMDILGYVGEELNKQLLYIAATSRKLADPISVMIVSESASGKSFLIDTVAQLIPPDEVISVTSLSEQALNYMEDLSHKFVSLGEIVHSETIEHQIREMLSKKELSRLVTTKEGQTGRMVTKMIKIPATVSLAMSGTRYDMNPENTSRCFVVNTDESREQTRRIHDQQRKKKYSLERDHEKKHLIPEIISKHHAAQKLLEPITIVNPFGPYLDFPDTLMRTRRDNDRFIDLIACVCFLRQYQKERKYNSTVEYIECDLVDYDIAYRIMTLGVLSSSLLEIPRGTIDLYDALRKLARERATKEGIEPHEVSFTQREIREATGFGQTWLKMHLKKLVDYEYVIIAMGGKARSKGYYRIRTDEEIESINVSMIPTPEEIKRHVKDVF